MKWLTIDYIKQHARIEYDCEDSLLELYGESAEQTVLSYLNRSYQDVLNNWGKVPEPVMQASLMLVDTWYTYRCPASSVNMSMVPYTFELLIKPYMRLTSCNSIIPPARFVVGSQIKILVDAELPEDLKMEDVDFTVLVYNQDAKDKQRIYDKSECILTQDGDYVVLVDSDELGIGTYLMKVTFEIPDIDYQSGTRKEILNINPNVLVTG